MRIQSVFQKVFNYTKNYGKPKEGDVVNYGGVILALIIIVFLTWLAFHCGVWYLSLLLVGEYKENYELFRYLNEHRN